MKTTGRPSPMLSSLSTAAGSRSTSCLRGVKLKPQPKLFPAARSSSQEDPIALSARLQHYRQISDFSSRLRLKLPLPTTSRPASTVRSHLDNAETVIVSCQRQLTQRKKTSKQLTACEGEIRASVKSILEMGGRKYRRFGAGRKQYLEEEPYLTREQVSRMLVKVRRDFKAAYRDVL